MRFAPFACTTILALIAVGTATLAEARPRRAVVIQGRSFLDSGKQVPVGSLQNYVTQSTRVYLPIYATQRPDAFGSSVLPGRFGGVGRGN